MSQFYTIRDLESLSGIKAHTIRIWEKRYELLIPDRTDTNIRRYDTEQLRKVLNVALLLQNGHKISKVSEMSDAEIASHICTVSSSSEITDQLVENQINQLTTAMITFDERLFDKLFSTIILRLGLHDAFVKILYPFLEKVGVLWCVGEVNPAMEHFITNLVKQKLFCAIDGLIPDESIKETWLLFLPSGEFHEIGLLLSSFLVRSSGKRSIYLGQDVPFESLASTITEVKPDHLLTFFVRYGSENEQVQYQQNLLDRFPGQKIHVAADPMRFNGKAFKEIDYLKSAADLVARLNA